MELSVRKLEHFRHCDMKDIKGRGFSCFWQSNKRSRLCMNGTLLMRNSCFHSIYQNRIRTSRRSTRNPESYLHKGIVHKAVRNAFCWLVSPTLWLRYISTSIVWFSMKCGATIHGTQRMNPSEFGDPLTFSFSTTMRLTLKSGLQMYVPFQISCTPLT